MRGQQRGWRVWVESSRFAGTAGRGPFADDCGDLGQGARTGSVSGLTYAHSSLRAAAAQASKEKSMSDAQIKNVEKDPDGVSGRWKWTVSETVASIESRSTTFYVMCPQRADVVV